MKKRLYLTPTTMNLALQSYEKIKHRNQTMKDDKKS